MQSVKAPRKITKRAEMREDVVVTASSKAFDFFEDNKRNIILFAGALLLALLAIFAWQYFKGKSQAEASEHLGRIVASWEAGNYREALDGKDERLGLLEIVDQYGSTNDGNLAKFYAADSHYQLGEHDEALDLFSSYNKGADYLGVSALAGEAAILEDREDFGAAASRYEDAALKFENAVTTPDYLVSAARNYEKDGKLAKALSMFEMLSDKFPDSPAAANTAFHTARLTSLGSK